jgi:hypothetical protein
MGSIAGGRGALLSEWTGKVFPHSEQRNRSGRPLGRPEAGGSTWCRARHLGQTRSTQPPNESRCERAAVSFGKALQ